MLAPPAMAQKAEADAAFQRGKALMAKGDTAQACTEFEASMRLEPLNGTLYNLALCHEALGKFASAWSELRELATNDKNAARAKDAAKRAAAIEKKLTRMRIVVTGVPAEGLTIQREGIDVTTFIDTAVPVDPARYTFVASAPGHESATVTADLTKPGATIDVTIPALAVHPEDKGHGGGGGGGGGGDATPAVAAWPDPNALARTLRPLALPKKSIEVAASGRWATNSEYTQDPIDAGVSARAGLGPVEVNAGMTMHARYGVRDPAADYRPTPIKQAGIGAAYVITPLFVAGAHYSLQHPLGGTRDIGADYDVFVERKYVVSPRIAFTGGGGISYVVRDRNTNNSDGPRNEFAGAGFGSVELVPVPRLTLEAAANLHLNLSGTLYGDTFHLTVSAGAYLALNTHTDAYVIASLPSSAELGDKAILVGLARRFP